MDDVVRERLRAIKSLAYVGDESALQTQRERLSEAAAENTRVQAVIDALECGAHGEAVALIEGLLADKMHPPATSDTASNDLGALQEEIERLETMLAERESKADDLRRAIQTFSARYRDELGPLVNQLLRLRKKRLESSLYANRSSTKRRSAYNEAEAQFERFQRVLETSGDEGAPEPLSDDDQARLKATYRRASKLCHPDMVDEAVEDEARAYFNELREAYQHNDLERVASIAETLEASGFGRRSGPEAPPARSQLEARAERLRERIDSVEATLDELRASKPYEVITSVSDLDAYFDGLKRELRQEIRQLRRGHRVR